MHKIIISICLVTTLFLPATSIGIESEFSLGAWYQKPSGSLSFDKTSRADDLDLANDLGYDDKWQPNGRLKIIMPKLIPNLYLMYTHMKWSETGSKNVNFNFGGIDFSANVDFESKLKLNHLDAALFYGIPGVRTATKDVLNIDLGLNFRLLDFRAEIEQKDIGERESVSYFLPVPMIYGGMQIEPVKWLALDLEGRAIAYNNNHYASLSARLKVKPFGPLFVAGGYRYDNIKIDYKDVDVDAEFKGPFAEVGLKF